MRFLSLVFFLAVLMTGNIWAAPTGQPVGLDPQNTLVLTLKSGNVYIKLRPDLAPMHVERIKTLTRQGFYDNIVFHRVIDGFMAQTGDPTGTGTGGSSLPDLKAEFSKNVAFKRGTVGMARSSNPNSANSQWFINYDATPSLDGEYTVWGEVVQGMEHVDQIKKGEGAMGLVSKPQDRIVSLKIAADIKAKATN